MGSPQSTIVGLKAQECPGWTEDLERRETVSDCLSQGVCGCIYGDAVKHMEQLRIAVEALRDFREFVLSNATQWRVGAGHHNPMWQRVAEVLDKHGENHAVPENTFRAHG